MKDNWVIVFLIYADFRENVNESGNDPLAMTEQMKAELNSLFKDILTVPIDTSRARMYVIINSIDYKEHDGSETEAKTLFYEIGNPDCRDHNEITYCEVISNRPGNSNIPNPGSPVQNPEFLRKIISRIPVYKNEEVFFCTHDHGSAFGIFRETDPGKANAEIRWPIQNDLKKYKYLAVFWNRALEEDSNFKKIMTREKESALPKTVQIGRSIFKIRPNLDKISGYEQSILASQTSLSVLFSGSSLDGQNLLLIFDKTVKAFEIWDNNLSEKSLHLNINVIASLENEEVREILRNEELAYVFENWLGEKKVAVLLMMNCWMMNLHTMYSFRETVKCLVAPQGNIGTPGYNYKAILRYLFSSRSVFATPEDLAVKCVTSFDSMRMRKRSVRLRRDREDVIDRFKIFAMDLQRRNGNRLILEEHFEKLNEIILLLTPKNKNSLLAVQLYMFVRSVSYDFSKEGLIDEDACLMVDFVEWLYTLYSLRKGNGRHQPFPVDDDTIKLIGLFAKQIHGRSKNLQIVLAESNGKSVYGEKMAVVKLPPTGYSLFFPNSLSRNKNLIDNVRKDILLNNPVFLWKEFIKTVYPKKIWEVFFDA